MYVKYKLAFLNRFYRMLYRSFESFEQELPNSTYGICVIWMETEIWVVGPFDLKLLLFCHYKWQTATAELFCKLWRMSVSMFVYTVLFEMNVGVLTTCHTQYTWDRGLCIFLFNRTTLQVFVTYLIGGLYVHPLWLYKQKPDNRVRSKLFVACDNIQIRDTCGKRRNINLIYGVTP